MKGQTLTPYNNQSMHFGCNLIEWFLYGNNFGVNLAKSSLHPATLLKKETSEKVFSNEIREMFQSSVLL